ncbi:MAG: TIM barrel protein [Spirochaetales bacterium]|nr:TIM barrel protein [Spirochaetales bacterium]
MSLKFAIAPCSWGIEDPENIDNPPWKTVLDEAGMSGFIGVELGPYGYLPVNPSFLRDSLESKQLNLIAGTLYDNLTGTADLNNLKEKTRNICRLLSEVLESKQRGFIVIIDRVNEMRNNTAGHPELARRMNTADWKLMMENIRIVSKIAAEEFGIRPVVHPHAGGFIEFNDETEKFLNDIPGNVAGLCLDTGHLYYAGDDPAQSLVKYSSRVDYVHFKDINKDVYKNALEEKMGFFDACKLGVMCSIGRGCVDYRSVFSALDRIDYSGWVTIEQERDPKDYRGTLDDIKMSYDYLVKTVESRPGGEHRFL